MKWAHRLNGPLATRIEELQRRHDEQYYIIREESELDRLFDEFGRQMDEEHVMDLPPETFLRRLEHSRAVMGMAFQTFDWLLPTDSSCATCSNDHPRVLTEAEFSNSCSSCQKLQVCVLTSSHQIKKASMALRNCAVSYIDRVHSRMLILVVLCPDRNVDRAVAMASWDVQQQEWCRISGPCNTAVSDDLKNMFLQAGPLVKAMWKGVRTL